MTPLLFCAFFCSSIIHQTKIVQILLDHGANVDEKTNSGNTSLHQAAFHNSSHMTQLLMSKGANVNAKNNDNATPLHFASMQANVDIACALIDHGANLMSRDTDGDTPLDVAANDHTKNAILTRKLGMMSRENTSLRQELQELRQEFQEHRLEHQDVKNFIFAVFGSMDRPRTDSSMETTMSRTTTTSDRI